jgi:hypothetical protein
MANHLYVKTFLNGDIFFKKIAPPIRIWIVKQGGQGLQTKALYKLK